MSNLEVRFFYLQTAIARKSHSISGIPIECPFMHAHLRAITREHKRAADICIPGIDQDEWRLGTYHGRYAANLRCGTGRLSSPVSHEGNLLLLVGFRRLPTRGEYYCEAIRTACRFIDGARHCIHS